MRVARYLEIAVLGTDELNHVTWSGLEKWEYGLLPKFQEAYEPFFSETQHYAANWITETYRKLKP
jgi:hypothetical protein